MSYAMTGILALALWGTVMAYMFVVGKYKAIEQELKESKTEVGRLLNEMSRFRSMALIDGLTSIPSRRGFEMMVDKIFAQHERENSKTPMTMALIDLDAFKTANDDMGHSFGDEILSEFGALLKHVVRSGDVIGRLGGDEFAILFVGVNQDEAQDVMMRVRAEFESMVDDLYETHGAHRPTEVSLSFGLTEWDGEHRLDLIRSADSEMYDHKRRRKAELAVA
jgi:diguanylate cyclase (GGDEF)-like protein